MFSTSNAPKIQLVGNRLFRMKNSICLYTSLFIHTTNSYENIKILIKQFIGYMIFILTIQAAQNDNKLVKKKNLYRKLQNFKLV